MILTTARKPGPALTAEAQAIAAANRIPFIPRGNSSLQTLIDSYGTVLSLSYEHLSCHTATGELFFHPNMAAVRIRLLRQGQPDKLLDICDLRLGFSFLDCTAGLCSDSLVAKFRAGEQGRVLALEKSLPIYLVMKHGLSRTLPQRFRQPAQGIELIHADFRSYLPRLPDRSFDVVYLDPMFDVPVHQSSSLQPLRPLAADLPLSAEDIAAAARVAAKRVVVKQRSFFDFSQLGLVKVGGDNRKIAYGVLETADENT